LLIANIYSYFLDAKPDGKKDTVKINYETRRREEFPVMGALAAAVMEHTGMREHIDSMCEYDRARRNVSPGTAVEIMLSIIFGYVYKAPLSCIDELLDSAPVDQLFGPGAASVRLGDSTFGRALDTLFDADRAEMIWKCSEMCAAMYGLSSDVLYMDATNISLHALPQEEREGVAVPNRSGCPKDGFKGRTHYSMMAATDSNGLLRCLVPHSGSASDVNMDRDMIERISKKIDCPRFTIVGDCKLANEETVDLFFEKDLGFVTKCPTNFAKKARDRALEEAEGNMRPCGEREGATVYDADMEVCGRTLRFVVYNLGHDEEDSIEFYMRDGEKRLKAAFGGLMKEDFSCRPDAERALEAAAGECALTAYEITAEVAPYETRAKRPSRGRPRKGEASPPAVTVYRAEASWEFDETLARRMGEDHGTQVLVTNLPRSDAATANIRDGADAETVMAAYLGEYKVEHTFRLMKSGLGVGSVYLHTPERENAMMFVIGVATIVSNIVDAALAKIRGKRMTMGRLCRRMMPVAVEYDCADGSMAICGREGASEEVFRYLDALGISHGLLLGRGDE